MSRRLRYRPALSLFAFQDIITAVSGVIILIMLLLTLSLTQLATMESVVESKVSDNTGGRLTSLQRRLDSLQAEYQKNEETLDTISSLPASEQLRHLESLRLDIHQLQATLAAKESDFQDSQIKNNVLESANSRFSVLKSDLDTTLQSIEELEKQLAELRAANRVIFNPDARSKKRGWLIDLSEQEILAAEVGKEAVPKRFSKTSQRRRTADFLRWAGTRDPTREYFVLIVRPKMISLYHHLREGLEAKDFDLGFDLLGSDDTVIDLQSGAVYAK